MATANVNVINEGVNLEDVKQLIAEQEPKWPKPSCDEPLYVWKIPQVSKAGNESQAFGVGAYICKLKLKITSGSWHVNFYLDLTNEELYEDKARFHSFQHFVCKIQYRDCFGTPREKFSVSTHPLYSFAQQNDTRFNLNLKFDPVSNVTVEVFVEPSTYWNYVSPSPNAVVGKIENFEEKQRLVSENRMLLVSPLFDFGSPDQKMIARFWRTNESDWNWTSLWVTLSIINEKETQVGLNSSFKLSIIIFNNFQQTHFIKKVVLQNDKNVSEYPFFLSLEIDLINFKFLENDCLYYKIFVEPFDYDEEVIAILQVEVTPTATEMENVNAVRPINNLIKKVKVMKNVEGNKEKDKFYNDFLDQLERIKSIASIEDKKELTDSAEKLVKRFSNGDIKSIKRMMKELINDLDCIESFSIV